MARGELDTLRRGRAGGGVQVIAPRKSSATKRKTTPKPPRPLTRAAKVRAAERAMRRKPVVIDPLEATRTAALAGGCSTPRITISEKGPGLFFASVEHGSWCRHQSQTRRAL